MAAASAESRSVARILRTAFSVALVCLVLAGIAGFAAVAVTVRAFAGLVERELPLLIANDEMLQGLTDAEAAKRGLLISGDPAFLERYEPGKAQFFEMAREAARLADTPALQELIAAQEAAGRRWITEFADPVIELQASDHDAALARSRSGAGERRFDELRALSMDTEREVRGRVHDAWGRALLTIWAAGAILTALIVVALVGGARAALRATEAVNAPLERLVGTLQRLAAGDLTARAEVDGPEEIAAVAQALNDLAGENERLIEMNRQRLAVAGRIRRVAALLHSQLQMEPVLACAAAEAGRIMADRGVVHRIRGDQHETAAAWCAAGIPSLRDTDGVAYPAALLDGLTDLGGGHEIVKVADVLTDERFDDEARQALDADGIRAVLLTQLRGAASESLLLAVHATQAPRRWSTLDVALFEGIAREARHALANAAAFEQQQRAVEQLKRLDEDKSTFMSNVSHELRTPLTSIIGYLELLEDGDAGALTTDQSGLVKTVSRNSKRLLDLIEELLFLSRIDSGAFTMARDPVALATVVHDVVDTLRPQFRGPSATLRVEIGEEIGHVLGDRHHLERVLFNLLTNAAKFTPVGGEVGVTAERDGGWAQLTVADTGIGIPRGEQKRVFERFFRSSTARAHAIQGTGLGLAITKSIVERHGGTISVTSAPGTGTTFTVRLPLAREPAAPRAR